MNPKISVIIPCYNAEKFLRQCLISILSCKFTDYEVILVDDCSTDKSVAEAEKLLPHFDGRLKIISTEKNSGSASIPRNLGIKAAAGKYVTFVDNDDMLLPTALENFFEVAEKFKADVVHTEKTFEFNDSHGKKFSREDLILKNYELHDELVEDATAEPKNFDKKIQRYVEGKIFWMPWGKLYRRNFLLENKIDFPHMKFSEDMLFCFKCLCLAKNYIRVPFAANIRRLRADSQSRRYIEPNEGANEWLGVILKILEELEDFLKTIDKQKYFRQVAKFFIEMHFKFIEKLFTGLSIQEVNKIFLGELSKPEIEKFSRGKSILISYFCTEKIFKE